MIERMKDGKLLLDFLDLHNLFAKMLDKCENEEEIEWLVDRVIDVLSSAEDERLDELF